jgi:ligand-binding sensor domain-containing protein
MDLSERKTLAFDCARRMRHSGVVFKCGIEKLKVGRSVLAGFLFFFMAAVGALALDPTLEVAQYDHVSWSARDGGFRGAVLSITQTPDGYLWLGTGFGLVRFDGVRFVNWQPPKGSSLPKPPYWKVYASRDGSLWIGSKDGLVRVKDGKVTDFPQLHGVSITAITEDKDGTVWAGGTGNPRAQLCGFHNEQVHCFGGDGAFGIWVRSIYEDQAGNLWVGSERGVWRWKPGVPKLYPSSSSAPGLSSDEHGTLLIANYHALGALTDGKEQPYPIKISSGPIRTHSLLRDKDGGVWIGTEGDGLAHLHGGKFDTYRREDGLTNNSVVSSFEDREGNIWVGTYDGLDRFRNSAIPSMTSRQVPGTDGIGSVLATRDGSVWFSGSGLTRIRPGQVDNYNSKNGLPDDYVSSLFEDHAGRLLISTAKGYVWWQDGRFIRTKIPGIEAFSMTEDSSGDYWIADHDVGLIHVSPESKVLDATPWSKLGRHFADSIAADRLRGGIWLGTGPNGPGLMHLKDGKILEQYGPAQGFKGQTRDIRVDEDGTVWTSSGGGLGRLKDGKLAFLNEKNGLPCGDVFWRRDDNVGSVWLLAPCGLLRFAKSELDAWSNDPTHRIKKLRVFNYADGVMERFQPGYYSPQATKAEDGRMFFAQAGLGIIDPLRLPSNELKPPTIIEQITADGKDYDVSHPPVSVAPLARDLRIDYTALSLANPGRVRFRYKLENYGADWQDPGTRRQAFYTDLPPGRYRFRVIACNNDGVWNEEGATLDFRVEPAWYQTMWFRFLCIAIAISFFWSCFRLRVRYIVAAIQRRAAIRADERVRIARDVHDTLLQGVQALTLRFHIVSQNLPEESSEREAMEAALTLADRIVIEARDRVSQLRADYFENDDLCNAFEAVAAELDYEKRVRFSCEIEGNIDVVNPLVVQELYYVGREAVVNAFRHSRANEVAVLLRVLGKELVLTITDDGCGFDPGDQLKTHGVKAGVKVGQRGGAKVGQWMAMQLLCISWGRASGA